MAIPAPRDLKIGKIIDKTLAVLELNMVPALIFVAALTAANLPITYTSVGSLDPLKLAGGQLLGSLIGFVCGYFLLVAMLRRTGLLSRTEGDVFLPYLGMSILAGLAVLLGLVAIILPGLFLMARWIIAGPLLVGRGDGVMKALGESWSRTRGNELSIIGAALALVVLPVAVIIAARMFFEETDLIGMAVSQLAGSGISVVLTAMGVALYGMIVGGASEAKSFE